MKTRHRFSLATKLAVPVFTVLLTAATIIFASQYYTNRQFILVQAKNSGTSLAQIIEQILIVSPGLLRSPKLNDIVARFAKSAPGIDRISITDRFFNIIADSNSGRIGQRSDHMLLLDEALRTGLEQIRLHEHDRFSVFHISQPILGKYRPEDKSNIDGFITLEISIAPIQEQLNFSLFKIGIVVVIVAVFIGVAIQYFVRYMLIGPIGVLSAGAGKIGRGDLAHQISMNRGDEFGELAGTLNEMSRDLDLNIRERQRAEDELLRKERLATIGQMTATVSHELRNPLGAIRSGTDVIRKLAGDANPQLARAIALVDRSLGRCSKIITDLLDVTRIQELKRETGSVDDWLGQVLDDYEFPPGISLARDLNSGTLANFDPDRLFQAVSNVIDNACQAFDDVEGDGSDRTITVSCGAVGDRIELSIADTGAGMLPDARAKIFEPLYTTKAVGVGLGLPIVQQVMERHGGGVEVTSAAGRGTEFVLWLPANASQEEVGE